MEVVEVVWLRVARRRKFTTCRGKFGRPKIPHRKGLVLYWFPASQDELKKSSLRASRTLSLYAGQCISMELADTK